MAKVAFLSFYSGVVERGVETFVCELAKRLIPKHQVTIFQGGDSFKNQQIRTYVVKSFASGPKSSHGILGKINLDIQSLKILLFTLKAMPKIIQGKFDVIIPTNGGWQMVILRIASKFSGSKILVSGHAGMGADDAWNLFFRPDVFVALTKSAEKWAKKINPEQKLALIPNGVDLSKFNPKVSPKKISLSQPVVVCASALVPYKRIELTIQAVAKSGMSLLLLGEGEQRGALDSIGKRMLGNKYLRLNPPHADMPAYYRAGKVFTLASKTEAFGTSYIEAMACNLPIVATNDDTRLEIIGNAGILTQVENIELYAKDLRIAAATNYRNIPYDRALYFSWNKIAQKYSNLISEQAKK